MILLVMVLRHLHIHVSHDTRSFATFSTHMVGCFWVPTPGIPNVSVHLLHANCTGKETTMEKLKTVLTRLRSKISSSDTDAVYETLRASSDSSEKLLSPRDGEDVVHSLRNDLRKTRLRMKMLTTVLTSLVVFISLFWIMREFSEQGMSRKLPIHSKLPQLSGHFSRREILYSIKTNTNTVVAGNAADNVKFVYNKVPEVFSPAMEAVEYKEVVFHNNFRQDRTKWQGPPDDEVDKAWREIYIGKWNIYFQPQSGRMLR
jgi:hypothetical protein